jgi:hypothetical protein
MAKTLTVERVRREVKRMDPELGEGEEGFDAAVVLMSLLSIPRPWKPRAVARWTGVPERRVATYLARLRKNGVIHRGKLAIDWADPATGAIAFWLDVTIALGYIERVQA